MEHEYNPPLLDFTDSQMSEEERYNAIRSMLFDYECIVDFKKVNGELRSMPCTLKEDLMPVTAKIIKEDVVVTDKPVNYGLITVWCTDVQAWRAMKTMNVTKVSLPNKKWSITVEEDPETGEVILPLPKDLLEMQGWQEGDILTWEDNKDGSWSLTRKEK